MTNTEWAVKVVAATWQLPGAVRSLVYWRCAAVPGIEREESSEMFERLQDLAGLRIPDVVSSLTISVWGFVGYSPNKESDLAKRWSDLESSSSSAGLMAPGTVLEIVQTVAGKSLYRFDLQRL